MKRYLFFLRHYNDIDNITPAIYFFLKESDNHIADVVLYHEGYDFRNDPNLKFLNSQFTDRFRVISLGEPFDLKVDYLLSKQKVKWRIISILNNLNRFISTKSVISFYQSFKRPYKKIQDNVTSIKPASLQDIRLGLADADVIRRGLKEILEDPVWPSLVIFDVVRTHFVNGLLNHLRELDVKHIICLPVSPLISYNILREDDLIDINSDKFIREHDYSGFDAIGYVDNHFVQSYNELLPMLKHTSSLKGKTTTLGSIRFCPEWLEIREKITQNFIRPISGKTRIAFFPSRSKSNVNMDEFYNTLKILSQFPEYEVVVKAHTRKDKRLETVSYSNIFFNNDIDSSSLINWADIVLFWSTSVAIEGYMKRKFMVCLRYITANRNLYAKYNAGYIAYCKDDLLKVLLRYNEEKDKIKYNKKGRDKFIDRVVMANNINYLTVPKKYLEFMKKHEF